MENNKVRKRFIKFFKKEKDYYKMINQSEKGFVLIITDMGEYHRFIDILSSFSQDLIFVAWQWKHKPDTFTLYRECIFASPETNYNTDRRSGENFAQGMRFTVTCKDTQYFSYTKDNKSVPFKREYKFKNALLLDRMLKISELES